MQSKRLVFSISALFLLFVASACDSGTATPLPTLPPTATTVLATPTDNPGATPSAPPTTARQVLQPTPTALSATVGILASAPPGCPNDRMANSPRNGLGDDLFPLLGNAGYDVQHYDLNLTVDVGKDTIDADAKLIVLALKDLDAFNLDFRGLIISKLLVDGSPSDYARDDQELSITPPTILKAGRQFVVEVAYGGEPISASRNGSPTEGWTYYKNGIYVAGEPDGASTFYPVNEHPCDKATYTLKVTVPKPYVVASVGHLEETTDAGANATYIWSTNYPVASYLVGLNIGLFDIETGQTPDGVKLRSYFPHDLPSKVRDTFAQTPEMVQFLSDIFGPYPFEEYGVVVANTSLGFALETQTMSLFGNDVGTGRNPGDETALHELSHQWFGDSVSLEQWHDIWLNEGFATYAQWLWVEHTSGKQALDERVRLMYGFVNEENPPPPGDPPADRLFNPGVYLRGGLTLHALRLNVGDDTFFKILKTYAARYRHGNATTDDFIAVSEEISGKQLHPLFDSWLHDPKMPDMPELGLTTPASVPAASTPK
jgi:aminopeptidase N